MRLLHHAKALTPRLPVDSRGKPVPVSPQPDPSHPDSFESSECSTKRLWSELRAAGFLATSLPQSGPLGSVLSQAAQEQLRDLIDELAAKDVFFYKGTDQDFRRLSGTEAGEAIESGEWDRLRVLEKWTNPLPLEGVGDLQLLDALYVNGTQAEAPRPELAEAIVALNDFGHRLHIEDQADLLYRYPSGQTNPPSVLRLGDESEPGWNSGGVGHHLLGIYRSALGQPLEGRARIELYHTFRQLDAKPQNLIDLDFFHGSGEDRGLQDPELASQLRELSRAGLSFASQRKLGIGGAGKDYRDFTTYQALLSQPHGKPWVHLQDSPYCCPVSPEQLGDPEAVKAVAREVDEIWRVAFPNFSHVRGAKQVVAGITERLLNDFQPEHRRSVACGLTKILAQESTLPSSRRQNLNQMLGEALDFMAEVEPRLTDEAETTAVLELLAQKLDASTLKQRGAVIRELLLEGYRPAEMSREYQQRMLATPSEDFHLAYDDACLEIGDFALETQF